MSDGETGRPDSLISQPRRVRRLGVMGGTFDPIHHGHLVAASEVAHVFDLDEVVFVPTGEPWQKDHRKVSSSEDRYLMTVIATASNPRFSVSRVDIDRPGPTYTIDTLRELRALRGEQTEFFFITGADALSSILTWHDWAELFELAKFVGGCWRARGDSSSSSSRRSRFCCRCCTATTVRSSKASTCNWTCRRALLTTSTC